MQIKKIDFHLHLASSHITQSQGQSLTVNDALALYDILDIERGVILPGPPDGNFITGVADNKTAEYYSRQNRERFSWFCNVSLSSLENALNTIEQSKLSGAVGLGEFVDKVRFDDPALARILRCCEEVAFPFLFHMNPGFGDGYGVIDAPGLPLLEKALKSFPDLIIIGHSQPFWYEIATEKSNISSDRNGYPWGQVEEGVLARLLRDYPNLYCDLSANSGCNALMRDPDYAVSFLNEFQNRLLFATDSLVTPLGPWLDLLWQQGRISDIVYAKIIMGNAKRLLHFE